jgi:lipopolysaccharide transport system ATP-binding protein
MSETAIRVEALGKRYQIKPREPYGALRDVLMQPFRRSSNAPSLPRSDSFIWALRNVSLEVNQGEVVGIIGRNGAGKSTLLKILSRVTNPTEGTADIWGRVGSLLEVGTGFHPELTGRENIYLNGAILGMRRAEIGRKFDEIVAFAETEPFLDTPVKYYSNGMRVRLAFAVAAHLEPEILLVDEVLAVGDAAFQKKCMGKMSDVTRAGRTILFVSHNMAAIEGLCSRAILLESGRIVSAGAPADVIHHYLSRINPGTAISLSHRADRRGSGELRLTEVVVADEKGTPLSQAMSGQDVVIRTSYESAAAKPVSRLDLHVTFYDLNGQFLFNCSSEGSGFPFERLPARGRLLCHIPHLPLAPGRYAFNLYATLGGAVADWIQQAGYLDVIEGDFFGTGQLKTHREGFLVHNTWSHEPAS